MSMDPQQTKTDNFELPPPTAGPAPATVPSPSVPSAPVPDASESSAQAPSISVTGASAPLAMSASASMGGLEAEDVDLIEKAWILLNSPVLVAQLLEA